LAGDIYVRVNLLKNEIYERRGADLFYQKKISLLEALTGVTITLKHLDGQ
jgi:DnaJ family protein A protein 2